MEKLQHLLQPIKIRNMELKNRLVMPPMGTGLANRDGSISEANLAYFKRRVQSGAGLYITEIVAVHPNGRVGAGSLGIYEERFIPGLKKMAEIAHSAGAKIALQLHHAGRESAYQLKKGTALGPSAIPSYIYGGTPKEMTKDDIKEVIEAFGSGAARAREAGFDAVELHGAHGYLLCQFLSIHSNQRQDEYGGSMKNRARFIIECIQEVRRQAGEDFPISIRISVEEIIKNGYTAEDMQKIVPDFVKAGVDIIHASFGTHGSPAGIIQAPIEYSQGFNVGLARKIKEVVNVPVIGVGRFTDPAVASQAIARGDADLIAVGRQHLADPDFLKNVVQGYPERTFECLACNQGCIERLIYEGKTIRCAINPETGQELIYPAGPAKRKYKVWVIGGGPAGLTAASEAARLGHRVTLFEKESVLGGQVRIAARAPYKKPYADWINKLAAKAKRHGADIRAEVEVTKEMLLEAEPEIVILASGGKQVIPPIEGIELPLVVDAWRLLKGEVAPGSNVLVIGGGLTGMETADYITQKTGAKVILVEEMDKSPVSSLTSHGNMLKHRLKKAGCRFMFAAKVTKIQEDSVTVVTNDGEQKITPIDQVVIAAGAKPRNELEEVLKAKNMRYYLVGDAANPRRIIEAVEEGAKAAWDICE